MPKAKTYEENIIDFYKIHSEEDLIFPYATTSARETFIAVCTYHRRV
jgi:hypothetical protein